MMCIIINVLLQPFVDLTMTARPARSAWTKSARFNVSATINANRTRLASMGCASLAVAAARTAPPIKLVSTTDVKVLNLIKKKKSIIE